MSSLRQWLTAVLCVFAITSLSGMSRAQDVLTWHNDNNRTAWQASETTLTPTTVGNSGHFGLVNQYTDTIAQRPLGAVYAQPLAVSGVSVSNCPHSWPCDVTKVPPTTAARSVFQNIFEDVASNAYSTSFSVAT